ncbi:26S proteasome regulatory subunit [Thermoplasma volcanium GSS1]|uniref:26S proteasome regulatory subunit n=1 Tax=Thermoplasma volcanium (strain ATCC 51530 / DSM 4299 / JCM 9571 / NBRC 15438 / GSS1) TaxID=273116 RepID=Q97BR9_THEVO|nr:ATP-binding protein [Thermoplasma volcanium]BAB59528.1 26S proteasome regulatory subunit [Thermoplasma volcanium GSS1]
MSDDVQNKIEKATKLLHAGIKEEENGHKDKAKEYYLVAYRVMLEAANDSPSDLKKKRLDQCALILNAYKRVSGERTDFTVKKQNDDEIVEGEALLEEIGIEKPEIPKVTFEDVAGLDDVKNEILGKIIYPMKFKELSQEYNIQFGGGMLLYGPPGTGKTFIVKAIANEVKARFINVNPSTLYSEWFGVFEKNISKLFRAASLLSPAIIFFDEIDALVPKRDTSNSDAAKRGVAQLLNEVGGINSQKNKNIFIIAATNNPWEVDEAMLRPGRFDIKIYVPPPDIVARKKIFQLNLAKIKQVGNVDYDLLAEETEGYSGADIEFICKKAAQNVFMEAVKTGKSRPVETRDVIDVIGSIKPSIDYELLEKYSKYGSAF